MNERVLNVGIVGTRTRDTLEDLNVTLDALTKVIDANPDVTVRIVSGGCPKGGDRFAEVLAEGLKLDTIIHLPDKSQLPENPKRWDFAAINYARNTLIARDSDVLIACVAPNRKGGTEDTVKKFLKMYKGDIASGKRQLVLV